jgi:site-specific DNA-methyltransferase (adenine-specific)
VNFTHLGDCLDVLRSEISDEIIDLVHIDPPLNSKTNYNIFFDDKDIQSQPIAFEDTPTLKNIRDSLAKIGNLKTEKLHRLLMAYQHVSPQTVPYLVMMSFQIIELRWIVKPTESFYLYYDPK